MEERLLQFISALRNGGVRISMAESADAFQATREMGIMDRETFRLSLRSTLVKDFHGLPTFDELFPLFFDSMDAPPMFDLTEDMSPEEAQMLAQMMRQFSDQLREMMEKLLRGEQLSQQELQQLGQLTGLNRMDDMRYREWMANRMRRALRFDDVRDAMQELMQLLEQMGMNRERMEQMRELIKTNQQALSDQIDQFAGERIAQNMSEEQPEDAVDNLMDKSFGALSDRDMVKLRREMQRLANRLRSRVSLRQKRAKSGQLDAKATIRANMRYGTVPVELKQRSKKLKPKLVVICDISGSMRYCSELMLSLVYSLQDLVTKTHAFAFIDHLEYISPDFAGRTADEAIQQVMIRMPRGYYSTDLGYALVNFQQDFMDTIDHRTTLIMVGDGRNNYNNPQLEIFRTMAKRSRRAIWINPEPPPLWGTGDSDMLQYAPLADDVVMAATMGELTEAVDHLLSQP